MKVERGQVCLQIRSRCRGLLHLVTNGTKYKQQRLALENLRAVEHKTFRNLRLRNVRYRIHNSPTLLIILSQYNLLQPSPYHSLKMHYSLPSHYTSFSNRSLSFPLPNQIPSCSSVSTHITLQLTFPLHFTFPLHQSFQPVPLLPAP
jgi:hypothetical protein